LSLLLFSKYNFFFCAINVIFGYNNFGQWAPFFFSTWQLVLGSWSTSRFAVSSGSCLDFSTVALRLTAIWPS